jgi:hypothetical protein
MTEEASDNQTLARFSLLVAGTCYPRGRAQSIHPKLFHCSPAADHTFREVIVRWQQERSSRVLTVQVIVMSNRSGPRRCTFVVQEPNLRVDPSPPGQY